MPHWSDCYSMCKQTSSFPSSLRPPRRPCVPHKSNHCAQLTTTIIAAVKCLFFASPKVSRRRKPTGLTSSLLTLASLCLLESVFTYDAWFALAGKKTKHYPHMARLWRSWPWMGNVTEFHVQKVMTFFSFTTYSENFRPFILAFHNAKWGWKLR